MKNMKRIALALSMSLAASLACAFPDKPVRLVVPYPAGGPVDSATRLLAERLQKNWGQPVIVENRPGASGALGTEYVVKSPADGYTMLVHSPVMWATELNRPSVNYRTMRDVVPVSVLLATPIVFVASNGSTQGGLKEILAAAAAKPGEVSYGSHGEGTSAHYMGERLSRMGKVQMTHVPYAGESPIITALMGGHVGISFISGIGAKKVADSGRGRMIAVASPSRSPLLPDVPTFGELGFKGLDRSSWAVVLMPAGAPKDVVDQVAKDIDSVVKLPEVRQRFLDMGVEPRGGTAAEALSELRDDYAYWVSLVKDYGVLAK